ncbi:MAG: DUF2130 domain-containing protein [Thaumarchaeota archaeon]|jgi:hypothetical protein|nr:DUF2130 domain-containing protein [Candidatus Nitrosopelagicus sp.]MBT6646690.1 DUF2130 domain-containing protein [Nitrososphaerota archaeon]
MATVIKTESRKTKCACCGTNVDANDMGRAGLTPEILEELGKQIHDKILEETFVLAKSVRRQMNPSATSSELLIQETMSEGFADISKPLNQMSKTIAQIVGGTGKGEVAELLTTEALRQFFPQDEFDTAQASKGGTDLVAKVFDRKTEIGKITISIKDTKTWKNEFKEQIEKNMEQDSTKIGILVSEKLPKRTNQTGEVVHNNGILYFLVHPKYATALYAGLRQVVIYMNEKDQDIRTKEKELMQTGKISQALVQWISGEEREQFQRELDAINEDAEATIQGLQKTGTYMTREIKKACDRQTSIKRHLLNQESNVRDLNDVLNGMGEEE